MNFFSYTYLGDIMLKKKLFQVLIVLILVLFSFYYTNKTIDIIRQTDPIMKQIKLSNETYYEQAENAKIKDDKITPGKNGKEVDYDASYQKMKRYGAYNESLTVFKETTPTVSIEDTYDKFITSGNEEKKQVSIIFPVKKEENINSLIPVLKQENIKATFFLDGIFLEKNLSTVKELLDYEIEILSYNDDYEEVYFKSALNYLKNVTGNTPKYCYASYDNKEVIELCSNLKLHTIIPTIQGTNHPYQEVKNKLQNASIISLPITKETIDELSMTINFIQSKGYEIVTLEQLLSESLEK